MSDELLDTASVLAALGTPVRLEMVQMLVRAGEQGLSVGEIQTRLSIPRSTVSHHLQKLVQNRVITQRREGTTLHCCANYDVLRNVTAFLWQECCSEEGCCPPLPFSVAA